MITSDQNEKPINLNGTEETPKSNFDFKQSSSPTATGIEELKKTLDTHEAQLTLMQAVSLGVIVALCLGLVSAIEGFNAMRREADQFKSQLFVELIRQTQDTNTKINTLVK